MAYRVERAGLNAISKLHQSSSSIEEEEEEEEDEEDMEKNGKKSGLSRIPKFNFSFRRAPSASASQPDPTPDYTAPVPKPAAPAVSRSKSLRLPRSTIPGRAHSSSSLHHSGHDESRPSRLKPRGEMSSSHSNPGSRSNSPSMSRAFDSNTSCVSTGSEMLDASDDLTPDEDTSSMLVRRTRSFSSNQRWRENSSVGARERGKVGVVTRTFSSGRSRTPTGSSRITASYRERSFTSSNVVRTISHEKEGTDNEAKKPRSILMRRTDSEDSVSGQKSSRGKRPSSIVVAGSSSGLTRLAQEVRESFKAEVETSDTGRSESSVSAVEKVRPAASPRPLGRTKSPFDRRSSPSPTDKMTRQSPHNRGDTPSPTHKSVLSVSSRLRDKRPSLPPTSRAQLLSSARLTRPSSARTQPSPGSCETDGPRSEETVGSRGGSRSSSPGSGHNTPVSGAGKQAFAGRVPQTTPSRRSRQSPTPETAGLSTAGRVTSLPPRTPYRVARVRGSSVTIGEGVGMNELEGSVLLEADDYRKIANDVKALKTMLLRMKREIQNESGTPISNGRLGAKNSDTTSMVEKLAQVTAEKDKLQEELSRQRKENKATASRLTHQTEEALASKEEAAELSAKLQQMEAHRDHLLDKVERLSADKYKLEARLHSLEQANLYEQSESTWLDELDEGLDCVELGDGRERKETESDPGEVLLQSDGGEGESSEPESAAVCSTPQS